MIRIMLLVAVVILPIAYLFSLPVHIAQKRYVLIMLYVSMLALFYAGLFFRKLKALVYALTIITLYVITFSNFLFLGPFYARAGWLVLTSIIASILFGTRGAVLTPLLNALMIAAIYYVIQPANSAWAGVYSDPPAVWTMFMVNMTLITLACSLPVSILLNRLDTTLHHEHGLRLNLMEEKEKMLSLNEALSREITQKEHNEQALRDSENRYMALFESSADAILIMQEFTITECNRKAEEMFGRSRDTIIGSTPYDLSPSIQSDGRPSRDKAEEILARVSSLQRISSFEWLHERSDGSVFSAEVGLTAIDIKGQKYIQAIVRDITDRKRSYQERERLQAQLVQAQKMEAIGTLAGGVAHDFNNILSSIIGYTELSQMHLAKGKDVPEYLANVLKACDRAKDLVSQILTFSRQSKVDMKPIMLSPIVREALKLLRASLPSTIEIRQDIRSDSLIMGNPTHIHQIVMNLATNASHAMREKGGTLSVTLTEEPETGVPSSPEGGGERKPCLRLSVEDTGHGMPPEMLDRIFEPFFTTKESGEGTGLGLAVIHGIVQDYGGTIEVFSRPGRGSRFDIALPVLEQGIPLEEDVWRPMPGGSEHILFVDDEHDLVEIGKRLLESLGYRVTTRTSSIEALRLFENRAHDFDAVISDLTMPNMTGDEMAKRFITIRSDIPIILCTGYSERIGEREARSWGIRDFISKPVTVKELACKIRKVLDEKTAG